MEELRLLDRRWHAEYFARRLGEFVVNCHSARAPSQHRGTQSDAPSSFRSSRRDALSPFKNSNCHSAADGLFGLVKRRTAGRLLPSPNQSWLVFRPEAAGGQSPVGHGPTSFLQKLIGVRA
jgi:hypothetical protein